MPVEVCYPDVPGQRWVSSLTGGHYPLTNPDVGREALVVMVDQPTLANTGVLSGVARTDLVYSPGYDIPSGTYTDRNFRNGELDFLAGRDWTFYNCLFTSIGTINRLIDCNPVTGAGHLKFYDCTFSCFWEDHENALGTGGHALGGIAALGIKGRGFEAYRCQFLGLNDCIGVGVSGMGNVPSYVVIEQCYMDKFAYWRPDQNARPEGTHNDGIAINGGTGTVIRGNTIKGFNDPTIGDAAFSEYTSGTWPSGALAGQPVYHGLLPDYDPEQWLYGAPIFVLPSDASTDGTHIEGNWITGGQWQANFSGGSGVINGIIFKDNRLGNVGTDDAGRYQTNVTWNGNRAYAADSTGNLQMNGSAYVYIGG